MGLDWPRFILFFPSPFFRLLFLIVVKTFQPEHRTLESVLLLLDLVWSSFFLFLSSVINNECEIGPQRQRMFQIVYVCVQIWESKGPPLTLGSVPFDVNIG
jgi:hypothetical protein